MRAASVTIALESVDSRKWWSLAVFQTCSEHGSALKRLAGINNVKYPIDHVTTSRHSVSWDLPSHEQIAGQIQGEYNYPSGFAVLWSQIGDRHREFVSLERSQDRETSFWRWSYKLIKASCLWSHISMRGTKDCFHVVTCFIRIPGYLTSRRALNRYQLRWSPSPSNPSTKISFFTTESFHRDIILHKLLFQ